MTSKQEDLETAVEFVPRPRQQGLSLVAHWLRPKPATMASFFAGADTALDVGSDRPCDARYARDLRGVDRVTDEAHHAGQQRALPCQNPFNLFLGERWRNIVWREHIQLERLRRWLVEEVWKSRLIAHS